MTTPVVPYAGIATRAVALAIDVAIAQVIVLSGGAILALVGSLVANVRLDTLGQILAAVAWLAVVAPTSCCSGASPARRPGCD